MIWLLRLDDEHRVIVLEHRLDDAQHPVRAKRDRVASLEGTAPTADSQDVDRNPYSLIGKYVLVGITRIDAAGSLLEKGERHGRITSVEDHAGIKVALSDGEVLTLPPNPDAFRDAKPGIYRLRSTGEEIVDPDLTTVWTIREPPDDRN